jgi:hypothetical protein
MSSETFTTLIETLLAGKIICEASAEHLYRYLEDEYNAREVDDYLRRIGRTLVTTEDKAGFYAAYTNLDRQESRREVRQLFREAANDLEPLVHWLRLVRAADPSGTPLSCGDVLRESELILAVENAPSLAQRVERLSRSGLFSNQASGPKKQISAIVRKLCENGYVVERGNVYLATARWSRLYELMDFIATHEHLDTEEEDGASQPGLLL